MIKIEDTLKELEKELKQVKKGLKKIQSLRAELVGAVEITQRKGSPTAEIKIMQWEEDAERITFHKVQTDELTCIQTIDPPKTTKSFCQGCGMVPGQLGHVRTCSGYKP
jgi:hypothetical protein